MHVFDESVGGTYRKKHALQRRMNPVSFILNSMTPEPVGVVSAPLETKQEEPILCAHRGYALAFFVVS